MKRPYKHTTTQNCSYGGGLRTVFHGSYATLAAAVIAAKRADGSRPDETRTITREFGGRVRNTYTHGPVSTWRETETVD